MSATDQISEAPRSRATKRKNSGKFPQLCADPTTLSQSFDPLGVNATKQEFDRLDSKLEKQVSKLIHARKTLEHALPVLSELQALLSQRGSVRQQILKEANLPGWTVYLKQYAQKCGYTARQLRNRIREFRGSVDGHNRQRPSGPHYREMLEALLETVERVGERCPVAVTTQCRNIRDAIAGRIDAKAWRESRDLLAMSAQRHFVTHGAPGAADLREEEAALLEGPAFLGAQTEGSDPLPGNQELDHLVVP